MAVLLESGSEQINHQANRGLGSAATGIAIGINLDNIEADELPLAGDLLHKFVDLGKVEAAGLVCSRAGSERGVHGIDIKRDIDIVAAGNGVNGRRNAAAMDFFASNNFCAE